MKIELNTEALKSQMHIRIWSQIQFADVSGLSLNTVQVIEGIEKTEFESQGSVEVIGK